MMKIISRRIWLSVVPLFVVLAGACFLFRPVDRRRIPEKEIREAGTLLGEAKRQMAPVHAEEAYLAAEASYDSAMNAWSLENRKCFFFRDYRQVAAYARDASILARHSAEKSGMATENLKETVGRRISEVQLMLTEYRQYYAGIPLPAESFKAVAEARQALQEGIAARRKGQSGRALDKIETAGKIMERVNNRCRVMLEEYFAGYPVWKEWAEVTVKNSKSGGKPCILIDKYARKCLVFSKGFAVDTFTVELGASWMGQKNHQGDRSTPEGIYRITALKSGRDTRFYKALLLDFPNEEDKKRFRDRKNSGEYGPGISIGGMIEIHGHGGKGSDWTEGCIALKNADMDTLFQWAGKGMPVAIVGSLHPLEEIIR